MSGIVLGAKPTITKPTTVRTFGARWAGGSSTQFTRLGDAASFSDPVPAVGSGSGSSPFDTIMPWSGMKEFNIIDGQVAYERGVNDEFSRSAYDTVVRVPKFWYKTVKDGSAWEVWIANGPATGFVEHPAFEGGDCIYVGRYLAGSGYVSKNGRAPLVNITRAAFRTGARGKGAKWDMMNVAVMSALQMLYLVEYADWQTQVIGKGIQTGSAVINVGGTDSMSYHTGRPSGTDGAVSIQYRGIEDLWGNAWQWTDGINFSGTQAYYCLSRSNFGDDKSTGYTQLGYNCCSGDKGFPKTHGHDANASWLFLPTSVGGSDATYIPDGWWTSTNWRVFLFGGSWTDGSATGLFARIANFASSTASASSGGRLLYFP